ncbi:hypothetical protein QUA42_27520, partial [Microcoleus sp. Pol11C2]|uniref:hypothetical protein n=1 Tax=Microcoleus sp. Pol11C2 TaxID=3055389 RepID=UPI002FD3E0D8
LAVLPACQTCGIQVKTIAGECIAKAKAREFLPLNKSSFVTDDRTNTRPKRIPQANSAEPSTMVTTISISSEYARLTRF